MPQGHRIGPWLDLDDVPWLAESDAETASLADRKAFDTRMFCKKGTILVDEGARGFQVGSSRANEFQVIVSRDEADLLAIGLVMNGESLGSGEFPDFGLVVVADGKQD